MPQRLARRGGISAGVANGLRSLGFGLPAELWIVQLGVFLNYLGWGAVLPFEVIYLHDGRGFSLGVAGLVVGTVTGLAVVAAPVAGPVIDRVGARLTAAGAGVALAAGYAGLALAHTPWQAFLAAAVAGAGNGGLLPSQSALVASLVPPQLRHRASAVSRVASNVGMGLGGAIGGLVAAHGLNGLVALFLANAATYLLYVVILVAAVPEDARPAPVAGGYGALVRDRPFVRLALTNIAVIGVGWGVFSWIVPPYARGEIGIDPRQIGLLLFANALTVVVAQLPVTRLAEGRRRTAAMAIASLTFVAACLLVVAADLLGSTYAYAVLLVAVIAVGVGECFHTTALMPPGRRPRPARPARPLHGHDRPVLVARPGPGPYVGHPAAEHLPTGRHADRRRRGPGRRTVRPRPGSRPPRGGSPDAPSARSAPDAGPRVAMTPRPPRRGEASGRPAVAMPPNLQLHGESARGADPAL
jgi:MFS family permease